MTKMFCDRCGKEITKEYGWITHRTLYASIKLLPGKKHDERSKRADLCICPECEDSYIHWFMNPETEARGGEAGMIDREKIIRGLHCCSRTDDDNCCNCPYDAMDSDCSALMSMDVLELLKEHEAQLVLNIGEQISCKSGSCPKCGKMLNTTCNKRYCGDCGQAVIWDG